MNWYYLENNESVGPCLPEELRSLYEAGAVTDSTPVRSDAMPEMVPLRDALQSGQAEELGIAAKVRCPTCGSMVDPKELIPMRDKTLCPNCRNHYLQSIKEGVPLRSGKYHYAGFGIRFAGALIDTIIMYVCTFLIGFLYGLNFMGQPVDGEMSQGAFVAYTLISYGLPFLYAVIMLGTWQATLGMMAVKIRIITVEGEDITYLRAVARYFAAFISALILGIGYLMVLWDKRRQTLHDKICSTYVIKKH